MYAHSIKRVPVMRDGKLVGIISRADLVRALIQKLSEIEPAETSPSSVNEALRLAREEAIADMRKKMRPVRR
jgi:signal-transduction protein with cAMP-binding, CBS, and nucleotidyltransferase domain